MTSTRWRMSASRAYELSPDLREKQVEMLCRKYGGAGVASHAARVIQQAYRRYRLSRSFARMRLEAAAASFSHGEKRLSRCLADADAALTTETRVVGGVCCRVRARDVEVTDSHGRVDTVRWTGADRRRQVVVHKSHSVSVTSTTTARHHQKVVVRSGCCVNPDTSSVASSDDGAARPAVGVVVSRHERRPLPVTISTVAPPSDDRSRSDDELLSNAVVPRSASNFDDIDQLTDTDEVHLGDDDQPATTTTFQQLCLTDSSYGDMAAAEVDSDADDTRPHYVDGDALEAVVTPRSHVYSSLRLCNSKHSTVAVASQSRDEVPASDSPIWKRKDLDGSCDDSKMATIRCVGCGWRGQSAPQLNDEPAVMTTAGSGSVSTGSLAAVGNHFVSSTSYLQSQSLL